MTQHDTILKFLRETDAWVPSWYLGKRELCGHWVGSRGERSARDLAEDGRACRCLGKDLITQGITRDFEDRPVEAKYAYYHSEAPKEIIQYFIPTTGETITKKVY